MDGHSKYIQSGKTKEILYKAVIFLGESLHCGYKENLKKLGKFRFNSLNLRKIARKMEKIHKVYNPQN